MANAHKEKGKIFLHRGDLVQAHYWYELALAEDRAGGLTSSLTETLGNLGNICAMLGVFDEADRCYREILAIQRAEPDLRAIGQTLVNLGNIQAEAGHPEQARPYYLEALDLLAPMQDHRALGILYSNLGLQDAAAHRHADAIAYFMHALDSHRTVGDEDGLAVTYSQMGKVFLDAGRDEEAEKCLNNASEHFIKLGNEPGEAAVLRLLASLYAQRGDRLSAVRCLERVVLVNRRYRLAQAAEDEARLAVLWQSRGDRSSRWIADDAGCYDAARSAREEDRTVDIDAFRQMVEKNPKGFLGRYGLGHKLLQEGGNLSEAAEHLQVAVQLDPTHVASHLALGRALVKLGRQDEARPVLQAGIDAAQSGRSSGGVDLVPELRALLRTIG